MSNVNMLREFIIDVTEAPSVEDVWTLHTQKMADYGFDRLLYGYTRFLTPNSFGDPQDLLVLTNHPSDYTAEFIEAGHMHYAPMVRWSLENEGACSWSIVNDWLQNGELSPKELEVLQFNKNRDVSVGYTVSFKSVSSRTKGAIALTAAVGKTQDEMDAVWEEHGHDIIVMNNVAHLKIISLPYFGARRHLTKRQREALEWVGDGKTTADIAQIMGLTSATIEKHLRLAREALDVETTAQAVHKASVQNQIFIVDPV
ncbi:MAG: LuxR family transcriptional regulator [Pseudomonadota bacterium]